MPLAPGTRLGPYEIVAPLGAGGMGEVYRARDSRLGRDVAIKVLPQHLSDHPEIRTRFEREAKTVGSLAHPNICTLFDVGREDDTDFLVMELVEGETLAQRLARGALPAAEVLRLGAQVADALDRAHRAGVIHRDLKPANIMVTRSGAKLMDFGLARVTGLAGAAGTSSVTQAALTHSPTVAGPLTAEGTIVGTFQYMSPEQLEGREADARSDLWALGCVLYEMATGRRAFEGRSQASLISAIMSAEPAPLAQVAPLAPTGLDRLVTRCLAKDPDDRWQTARDLMHELRALGAGNSSAGSAAIPAAAAPVRRAPVLPWAVAGVAFVAALTLAFALAARSRAPRSAVQASLLPPVTSRLFHNPTSVAISPDGRSVAYCASDSGGAFGLYVQPLDATTPLRIFGDEMPFSVFWSYDSRTIAVTRFGPGRLTTVPAAGGAPATPCAMSAGRGVSWNQDGVLLIAPGASSPVFRVPASGGDPIPVTRLDPARHESGHRYPCFLPDGKHFLFASLPPDTNGYPIYVGSLDSHDTRRIMTAGSAPVYAEPGWLLFRHDDQLMAQRFDAGTLQLKGAAVPIGAAPPSDEVDAEPVVQASRDGRLAMLDRGVAALRLAWYPLDGSPPQPLALPAAEWGHPVLSPDDRSAALVCGGDVWRIDLARSVPVRLTSTGLARLEPVWSPDGARIAYTELHGREEIFVMPADGSGQPRMLATTPDLFKNPECWTGQGLLFMNLAPQTFRDIWTVGVDGGAAASPLIRTPYIEHESTVSPDGHWLAYLSNEAGHTDVYVQSYPALQHKVRVTTGGAVRAWWGPRGDRLFFRTGDGSALDEVPLTRAGEDLVPGAPKLLLRLTPDVQSLAMAHDGTRALTSVVDGDRSGGSMRVILDWPALARSENPGR